MHAHTQHTHVKSNQFKLVRLLNYQPNKGFFLKMLSFNRSPFWNAGKQFLNWLYCIFLPNPTPFWILSMVSVQVVWTFANGALSINLLLHLIQKKLSNSFQNPWKKPYVAFCYFITETSFLSIHTMYQFLWLRHMFV